MYLSQIFLDFSLGQGQFIYVVIFKYNITKGGYNLSSIQLNSIDFRLIYLIYTL